jgi:hypothetical protein
MKKIKIPILSTFIISIIAFNLSIVGGNSNFIGNVSLNSLKKAFADEIEEITITCDSGGSGTCYTICNSKEEYCNGIWIWSWDCCANGDPNSWCEPMDPC